MFPFHRKKQESDLALTLLRFGVGSAFLWFGLDKCLHPGSWISLVPDWPYLTAFIPPIFLVTVAGIMEFVLGAGLLDGRYGRLLPSLASFWILISSMVWGVSETTVRNAGLLGVCLALVVMADRKATEHWPKAVVKNLGYAYVTFLLAVGIIFLRNAA